MAYLEVEGTRRIYFEHHPAAGPPVVLVHGWGASGRCWDTVAPALRANGNAVVLLDQRACGRSDKDFDDVSIAAGGADVARLCEHLGLREPIVNGWSLGGAIAVDAVARLGGAAGGLVLTGGATPRYTATEGWPHGGTIADVEAVLQAVDADRVDALRQVADSVCAAPVGPHVVDWLWRMFLEMGPRGDEALRDLAHVDQRQVLGTVRTPTLVLHGAHDGFVPFSGAEAGTRLCHDAQLVAFSESGHAPFLEERERYLDALLGFVNWEDRR